MAIKTLNSSTQEAGDDLQREATILGKLRHPHIIIYLGIFRDALQTQGVHSYSAFLFVVAAGCQIGSLRDPALHAQY